MSQRSLEWSGTWALGQLGSKNPFNKLPKFKLFIGFGWDRISLSLSLSLSANPTSCRTYKLMISAKNFLPLTVTVAMAVTAAAAAGMATGEEVDATVRVRVGTFGK